MAQASREAEADQVEAVYKWALAEIGIGLISDATKSWAATPSNRSGGYDQWLASVKRLVQLRRSWLIELAIAYYRLIRALRTGSTVAGREPDEGPVTIEDLRHNFDAVVDEIEHHAGSAPGPQAEPRPKMPATDPRDDDHIKVDPLDREWDDFLKEIDKDVEHQLDDILDELGPKNWEKKLQVIGNERPASETDKERKDAHEAVGRRTAAELERISLLYARDATFRAAEYDKLAIGWVRYSTTGTPCGFCAMLISRGLFAKNGSYKTYKTAGGGNPDQFHTNCHCVAVPVFSVEQFNNSPLFDLNREYAKLWPTVTKGLGGKDALSEWRKFFRDRFKKQEQSTAPEAA